MTGMKRLLCILLLVLVLPLQVVAEEEQTWTVNLKEADIRALVNQVADITGYSFVVDPRVQGKVTVISDTAMTSEAVYDMFLTVLQVHGFTAVPGEDAIKVVQQSDAKQSAEVLTRFTEVPSQQLMTEVIQIENVNALELVPILRPMVASYGHLAGVAAANALLISDHRSNIQRIKRLIRDLDRPSDYEMEVVQLKEAWVGDVVQLLEELGPGELGRSPGEGNRTASVVADERSNRLILRGTTAFRETVRNLITKLDQPSTTRGTTRVIRLNHADAAAMSNLLNGIMGEIAGEGNGSSRQGEAAIFADEGLNALVVRAEPALMNEVEFIIQQLDVRRAQVLIEAAIVEISDSVGNDLGVQFAAGDESGRSTPIAGTSFDNVGLGLGEVLGAIASDTLIGPSSGVTLGAGQQRSGGFSWGVLIQALSSSTAANLLSTPSIITLDNEESEIIVGQNVPFRTGQSTQSGDGFANPFTTIERKDIGLTLKVTPSISDDGVVRLIVEQTTEDITASVANAADLITNKREIKTSVLADDGETIVLGGLINEDYRTTVSKVPFLGDIPYLGRLFRSESQERTKRNLIVFLRPTILRQKGDANAVAERQFGRLWDVNLGMTSPEDRERLEAPEMDRLFEGNPLLPPMR
ncbi:MAG: type II secretion system protein GspD [Halomonadaceae bacterium]|nr:MAG: type II secretion system protein GspD [Halomonadaceae bacterium]